MEENLENAKTFVNPITTPAITTTRKLVSVGSQLGFSLPRDVLTAMALKKGDLMEINVRKL